jgi:hypothetical protein
MCLLMVVVGHGWRSLSSTINVAYHRLICFLIIFPQVSEIKETRHHQPKKKKKKKKLTHFLYIQIAMTIYFCFIHQRAPLAIMQRIVDISIPNCSESNLCFFFFLCCWKEKKIASQRLSKLQTIVLIRSIF